MAFVGHLVLSLLLDNAGVVKESLIAMVHLGYSNCGRGYGHIVFPNFAVGSSHEGATNHRYSNPGCSTNGFVQRVHDTKHRLE